MRLNQYIQGPHFTELDPVPYAVSWWEPLLTFWTNGDESALARVMWRTVLRSFMVDPPR